MNELAATNRPVTRIEFAMTDVPEYDYPPLPEFPPQITWKGKSGTEYAYSACYLDTGGEFLSGPVNFVIAKEIEPNKFEPIYVGETDDLNRLLDDKHMIQMLRFNQATHVCIHDATESAAERQSEKKDLIEYWNPPRNR